MVGILYFGVAVVFKDAEDLLGVLIYNLGIELFLGEETRRL